MSQTSAAFLDNYVIAVRVIVSREGCFIVILLPSAAGTSTTATNRHMGNEHIVVEYASQLALA